MMNFKYVDLEVVKDIPSGLGGYYLLPFIPKGTVIKNALFDPAAKRKLYKHKGDRYSIGYNSCVPINYVKEIE